MDALFHAIFLTLFFAMDVEKSACCKYIEPNTSHDVTAIETVLALLQQGCS